MAKYTSREARERRHERIRRTIHGTAERPRLNVFRSLQHIYAQVIDDDQGNTLVAASTVGPGAARTTGRPEQVAAGGPRRASWWRSGRWRSGLKQVVFDRGGYPYHGRVKALADGAREGGLEF